MAKTIAVIASAVLFSWIGLLAGYLAISHIAPRGSNASTSHDALVVMTVLGPTIAGAILGLVVGCVAACVGKKCDNTKQ